MSVSKALFENMSDELRNLSKEMSVIDEFRDNVKDVEEVLENINSPLTIMVMGEFSTGKSTFINALMGESITKVDAKPTTAVITKLVYGEQDRIVVHYQDGSQQEYSREEFARLTAEADEKSNEMHERMDYVERTLPIDMLKSMSIIDSPGLNSIKSVHEDMTRHFMDKADTVLWMFDANKPGSQTEIDALKRLNPRLTPLVLVNKIDGIDEEEGDSVEGILEGVERRLENNKIDAQGYIGVSAKMAFKGKKENRDNLVQASNIEAFYDAIEEKVLPGREQYKRNSLLDGLVKMIYGVGSQIKELRQKNEERKSSDYAAYVTTETELAAVWDELENIADIMLTDIEENQPQGRKRLNAAMKSFYGMLHWLGIFVEQDDEAARKYLEEAAVRGDEAAQIVLTECLWNSGEEEKANFWVGKIGIGNMPRMKKAYADKAKKCLECLDNRDEFEKNYLYLLVLADIEGTEMVAKKKYEEALNCFKKAAEKGNVEAMCVVAFMYYIGEGVDKDEACAKKWLQKAISAGYDGAKKCLSYLEINEGNELDAQGKYEEALNCFKKAAEKGNVYAMSIVGCRYFAGSYVMQDYNEAFKWLKKAAAGGHAEAMLMIGHLYEKGKGVLQDYNSAMEWYRKAAENGDATAMNNIGLMYHEGRGVAKDYTCARNWYQKAINAGNDKAKENLSVLERDKGFVMYEQGEYEEALNYFKKAAEKGDSLAMCEIGHLYENGEGVVQDYNIAVEWFKKSAESGNAEAMRIVGWLYGEGKGMIQNYNNAMEWYRKAAENGDAIAMNNLGDMYFAGKGVMQDFNEAFKWSQKAAENGIVVAMARIGWLYEKGKGVVQNYNSAMEWYRKAAAGGHAEAMLMIGHLYEKGKGVLQDYNSAMEWYRKAAENGDATAMNNIGSMYHEGRGVAKDYTCARNWYQKAISAGDVDGVSKKNLEILEEEIRRYAQTPSRQQSSGCFITTATCDNFGKPDNCYELNAFRLFRDNWLSSQPDGPELISEYHDVAPVIVEKINSLSNAKDIYADIWDKYLSKCLKFIEQGNNFQCKEIYVDMVRALQCRFL